MEYFGIDVGGTQVKWAIVNEDYQIIGKEKIHMDEREIMAEILEKRKNEV